MKLSKIKEIPPRTYWHNEATDFTPWLAEEDNLAQLIEVTEAFAKFFKPI